MSAPPLLLVAHGSRDPGATDETRVLRDRIAERVDTAVGYGFLDHADPAVLDAALALLGTAGDRVVVQPLLLFEGLHAAQDVPATVEALRAQRPAVRIALGRPLGVDRRLVQLAAERVRSVEAGSSADVGLLVTTSASADPDATARATTVARSVASRSGLTDVVHAPARLDPVDVPGAVARLAERDVTTVVLFAWSLTAGRLVRAVVERAEEACLDLGLRFLSAGHLGSDAVVADVVADRYRDLADEPGGVP